MKSNHIEINRTELIQDISSLIKQADLMRGAYFFRPQQTAGGRRSYEKYHSRPLIEWEENGHSYSAEYVVRCTCSNVYATGYYTKDGNKTTLTTIKNSLKRIIEGSEVK